jgi:hypothetical protein
MYAASNGAVIWRVSLARIEQVVAAHLGPGRVPGNASGPCFSRQVSMYLAKHVGRWSLSQIGKFYNGRHHTTVRHAITRIENLRKSDESVDALIEVLTNELAAEPPQESARIPFVTRTALIEAVATRVMDRLAELNVVEAKLDNVPKMVHTEG